MKKIKIFVFTFCLLIGTILFKVFYRDTTRMVRGNYQVYVNGVEQTSIPSRGSYKVVVACTRGEAIWDYDAWELVIEGSNKGSNQCYLEFNSIASEDKKYISTYIKDELSGTQQGDSMSAGQVVHETFVYSNTTYDTGYRYEGSNPNNYVKFNNELWRIIGTFSVNPTGKSTAEYLTKIIRNESIGSYVFDNSIWITQDGTRKASLNYLLNDYYYLRQDGTGSGYCTFSNYNNKNVTRSCDYRKTGINTTYRSMIEQVTWNIGGSKYSNSSKDSYRAERSTTIPPGSASTWDGYIGLMYPSDFGFSVLSTSCAREIALSAYNTNACGGQAWLLNYVYERTMSPQNTDTSNVLFINMTGALASNLSISHAVRPVLYLKSNVYIVDGDGSLTNPYILMM